MTDKIRKTDSSDKIDCETVEFVIMNECEKGNAYWSSTVFEIKSTLGSIIKK